MKLAKATKNQVRQALKEDIGKGDKTSRYLIPATSKGTAWVIAREKGIFCGKAVADEVVRAADRRLKVRFLIRDGQSFRSGKRLLELKGPVRAILKSERTLLNLIGHLSGVSTRTRQYADRVGGRIEIYDTRKTTPLWRELEKYAVRCGGGKNHRMGLDRELFVKENHRKFGDLKKLKRCPGKFVIETRDMREVIQSLAWKPRVILLDNFPVTKIKRAAAFIRSKDKRVRIEASGGIQLGNILSYAGSGIDQVSVGELTHSAPSINLSLLLQ